VLAVTGKRLEQSGTHVFITAFVESGKGFFVRWSTLLVRASARAYPSLAGLGLCEVRAEEVEGESVAGGLGGWTAQNASAWGRVTKVR